MPLLRAVATALVLLPLSFGAAGQGASSPAARASASFAAAGGEDVTATRPAVTRPLIRAFEAGDREALEALSDLGRLPLDAIEGLDLSPVDREGAASLGPTVDRAHIRALVAVHGQFGGQVKLLRLLRRPDGWAAVFRLRDAGAGGEVAYVEAMVSLSGRLLDLYFHWEGWRASEKTRMLIYANLAERDPGLLARQLGVQQLSPSDASRWREALVLAPNNAHAVIAEALDGMEAPSRATRQWMLERLRVAKMMDDQATARATMAHLEARFPDDPGLQLLFWRYADLRRDPGDKLRHLAAFGRMIAPDPWLDQLACRVAVGAHLWSDGVVACRVATLGLPAQEDGWAGLMTASGHAADTRAFIAAVEGYERRFERRLDAQVLAEGASMEALLADPVFQAWLGARR